MNDVKPTFNQRLTSCGIRELADRADAACLEMILISRVLATECPHKPSQHLEIRVGPRSMGPEWRIVLG